MSGENGFERIVTEGFLLDAVSVRGSGFFANYGDGYGEGVRTGHPEGLRTWKYKIAVLPDDDSYLVDAGAFGPQTRERYLWDFYCRQNVANWHKPFWLRDPKSGRDYLVDIAEEELTYQVLCLTASSTGLTLRQRRVAGQNSPGDPTEVVNPDSI